MLYFKVNNLRSIIDYGSGQYDETCHERPPTVSFVDEIYRAETALF